MESRLPTPTKHKCFVEDPGRRNDDPRSTENNLVRIMCCGTCNGLRVKPQTDDNFGLIPHPLS